MIICVFWILLTSCWLYTTPANMRSPNLHQDARFGCFSSKKLDNARPDIHDHTCVYWYCCIQSHTILIVPLHMLHSRQVYHIYSVSGQPMMLFHSHSGMSCKGCFMCSGVLCAPEPSRRYHHLTNHVFFSKDWDMHEDEQWKQSMRLETWFRRGLSQDSILPAAWTQPVLIPSMGPKDIQSMRCLNVSQLVWIDCRWQGDPLCLAKS